MMLFAEPWDDAEAKAGTEDGGQGWHLIVAIADVAWYASVPNLTGEARERGNSVYFPDRVFMLLEALSNGWCSLKPDEDRPCLAATSLDQWRGELQKVQISTLCCGHVHGSHMSKSSRFVTVKKVALPNGLSPEVIDALFGAYDSLLSARESPAPWS